MLHTFKGMVRRRVGKRVTTDTGFTTVPDGEQIADATLTVDIDMLFRQLGPDAMSNRSKAAKRAHGAIVLKVSNLRREPR